MIDINSTISIITLDVNSSSKPLRLRSLEWIKKLYPIICCPQELHFICKDTEIKSKGTERFTMSMLINRKQEQLCFKQRRLRSKRNYQGWLGHYITINSPRRPQSLTCTCLTSQCQDMWGENQQNCKEKSIMHFYSWKL